MTIALYLAPAEPGDPPLLLLTLTEAAERLGVTRRQVEKDVSSGRLVSRRYGRLRRILVADLEAFAAGMPVAQAAG
jgi:excisionase family DNA binding protein